MKRAHFLFLMLCLLMAIAPVAAAQEADAPVVRAVLFYSPTCPHCHTVINETLLPMMEQYGDKLVVIGVNITEPGGQALYTASTQQFQVPDELQGVPRLVVGDRFLVGSVQIPQEFPGIVEQGLADGGIDWPAIPGLAEALAANQAAQESAAPSAPAAEEAAAAPAPEAAPAVSEALPPVEQIAAPAGMPEGGWLAAALLVGMALALLYAILRIWPARHALAAAAGSPWIPLLAVLGLAVSTYLAYVEISHVAAVCGPVGECNVVQSSQYAQIAGLPVAVLGQLNYVAVLVLWMVQRTGTGRWARPAALGLLALALLGVLFSIYLTLLEIFVIHAVCIWCLSSALIATLILLLAAIQLTPRPAAASGQKTHAPAA
ncbi:MAG TPA: vitamin K epoxide reductase family protein [Anaerolineae bacterium]|nr:vitamin K epoxide reductase family protein [Anaerolineae bacterium]HNU05540.1 vitamin K epoxide reductase family protein [Anaerolineae bacterium]